MFQDGIYVSYFSDDENMEKDPKLVVVIENSKVNMMLSPKIHSLSRAHLNGIVAKLAKASSKDEYEDLATMKLGKYWEANGYIPNPSQFLETESDKANKVLQIARAWEGQGPTYQNMKANGYDIHPKADLSNADLSNADLSNADLSNANLQGANLSSAKLQGANLSRAELRCANLSNADLSNADLSNADLTGANLFDAELRYTNLSNAGLWGANLFAARLNEANLGGARLDGANLTFANLSNADLSNAHVDRNLTEAALSQAWLCGATMPDGSIHD